MGTFATHLRRVRRFVSPVGGARWAAVPSDRSEGVAGEVPVPAVGDGIRHEPDGHGGASAALVALHDVRKQYGGGASTVDALSGIDLEIARGELVVLVGPSGSGKTTLLHMIGGIEQPTAGTVRIGGTDLAGLDDAGRTAYRRDHVGFVFQFFNLIPALTARENVQLVVELTGHDVTRVADVLAAVGLREHGDRFPSQLSGGEQQRVAIARAIAADPDLLLCDEPTGALDLETGRQVLGVLQRHNREQGTTVVIVTHNTAIARMADRVVRMRSGSIVDDTHNAAPCDATEVTW